MIIINVILLIYNNVCQSKLYLSLVKLYFNINLLLDFLLLFLVYENIKNSYFNTIIKYIIYVLERFIKIFLN